MKVHRVELFIIDFDGLGKSGIIENLQADVYPNHCMMPSVISVETREVTWREDHPLNISSTMHEACRQLFEERGA